MQQNNPPYFYNRTMRKLVVAFGSLFDSIQVVRMNKDQTVELERIYTGLIYSSKEKYYTRLTQDPNLTRSVQVQLPKMSFEITNIAYDPTRKQNTLVKNRFYNSANNTTNSQFVGVPYNITFVLNAYVRNIEDGTQIAEQIFPLFAPDFNLDIQYVPEMGITQSTPVVLDSSEQSIDYIGDGGSLRLITWSFHFTMKAWFFGPVVQAPLIRQANIRFFDSTLGMRPVLLCYMANTGFGTYKDAEIVYQGPSLDLASASAMMLDWDSTGHRLFLKDQSGTFRTNTAVTGSESGANFVLNSFDSVPLPLVITTTVPNPISANADSDYGFTTTIEEFPQTL